MVVRIRWAYGENFEWVNVGLSKILRFLLSEILNGEELCLHTRCGSINRYVSKSMTRKIQECYHPKAVMIII